MLRYIYYLSSSCNH